MARVLVVDDDLDVLGYVTEVLSEEYEVVSCAEPLRALDVVESGTPIHLLLTDIKMPGLNGIALSRMAALRRSRLAVLYMTGYAEVALDNAGLLLGDVLQKPFPPEALTTAVRQAIDKVRPDDR